MSYSDGEEEPNDTVWPVEGEGVWMVPEQKSS